MAVSFLVLALLPADWLERFWRRRLPLFTLGDGARAAVSLISFAGFAILIAAGVLGSRDPLSNPLPLVIWTLLWAGATLLQGVFGDLWSWLNPWYGPWRLASRLFGTGDEVALAPSPLARPLASRHLVFRLRLVRTRSIRRPTIRHGSPQPPAFYWLLTFLAMLVFGYRDWSRSGEFLTVFFSMVARFAVVERDETGRLGLCWPGAKLLAAEPLPTSGIAFLLLALSSVSFDGLSKTFFWLGLFGINPLEFPGRTAMIGSGTFGLVLTFVLLAAVFMLAVLARPASCRQRSYSGARQPACWCGRSCRSRSPIMSRTI